MNKKLYLYILTVSLLLCSLKAHAQSASDILVYIEKYKGIALEQERRHGIPAPITLAQGIL